MTCPRCGGEARVHCESPTCPWRQCKETAFHVWAVEGRWLGHMMGDPVE